MYWRHSFPDEPVELWSELNAQRFEMRKVEVWADGRVGFAGEGYESGGTRLGLEPVPPLEAVALDPEFEPEPVSSLEFDRLWSKVSRHNA